jgi:hypothetical protein
MENTTITDSGTIVTGDLSMHGDQVAGRDINNNEINLEPSGGFAEINTAVYDETFYTRPIFAGALAEQIKDRRLVVIAGGAGFDKNLLARHLAASVSTDTGEIKVMEWSDPEDAGKIVKEIKEEESSSIFILPDTAPQNIQYDLRKLASVARDHSHYIIVTTEMTLHTWQQPQAVIDLYWFEVPSSGLYSKEILTAFFLQKLNLNRKLLDISPLTELHDHFVIGAAYTPFKIASLFGTPDQIDFFFTLLESKPEETLEEKIRSSIATATDVSETLVTKWYRTLSSSEKLIALGAALLEGMYDDQYFAVMQRVIENFWHHRARNLQSLDYCDLDFLLNFFKFEIYDDGRVTLMSKFPDQRVEIIRAAWSGHKRHILSAFTVITTLAGSSSAAAANKVTDKEINGTVTRGKRLRAVVAETISDIGIVSLQTAEPKLLELASAGDIATRRITAKAVARWRAFQKEEQMFLALERWKASKSAQVKSTVVFTLQYAAEYDSPGFLEKRIMVLLNSMADDDAVFGSMKEILPRIIENHLVQVKDDLAEHFAIHEKYSDILASGLVIAYKTQPHEVKQLLENWLNNCLADSSADNRRNKLTQRDNLLVLVLKIYRSIPYTGESDAIQLSYVWQVLNMLHDKEQRRIMRSFVLETAAYFINIQPEMAISYIEPIFRKAGLDERLGLVSAIGILYLNQRTEQQGGDYVWMHGNYQIPLWRWKFRPPTPIEIILFGWLQGQRPFAREIATLGFMEFARVLDCEEPALLQKAINAGIAYEYERAQQQAKQKQMDQMETYVRYPEMPQLSLWTRIKIFFWLLFRSAQEKIVLKELMRTLLMYKQTAEPAYLRVVVNRWKVHQHSQIKRMAWWIQKIANI